MSVVNKRKALWFSKNCGAFFLQRLFLLFSMGIAKPDKAISPFALKIFLTIKTVGFFLSQQLYCHMSVFAGGTKAAFSVFPKDIYHE